MPAALPMEVRQLAQALYFQGMRSSVIAEQLKDRGVSKDIVRHWADRYGWTVSAAESRKLMSDRAQALVINDIAGDVVQAGKDVRLRLAKHLHKCSSTLEKSRTPRSLAEVQAQQRKITELVEHSVKVFGWSDAKQSAVNVLLLNGQDQSMQDAQPKELKHAYSEPGTVIDVPSTPSEPGVSQSETPCRSTETESGSTESRTETTETRPSSESAVEPEADPANGS